LTAPNLVALVSELETKAREYRAIEHDTVIRQTAEKPLNDGTASALEEIAVRVRQIDSDITDPEQALAAVKELAAKLESEVSQANSQSRDLPDITSFLLNPRKMLDMLRDTGRQDGIRQAEGIVRKYLSEVGS
jgi:hypothetical protein